MMPRLSLVSTKRHWTLVAIALFLISILPISPASANMVLSEAILHFEPGKPLRKDIEVENPSSEN